MEDRQILLNRVYHHFKGTMVITLAKVTHTETNEDMIVYMHLKDGKMYARPYDMFISEVDHEKYPDIEQKYRFELVENYVDCVVDMLPAHIRDIIAMANMMSKEEKK